MSVRDNRSFLAMSKVVAGLLVAAMLTPGLTACEETTMTDAIYDVKRQNEAQLMALPGVVSVGVGRGPDGQPAIIVGMETPAAARAPEVPKELGGYPVVVQTTGKLKAQ